MLGCMQGVLTIAQLTSEALAGPSRLSSDSEWLPFEALKMQAGALCLQ